MAKRKGRRRKPRARDPRRRARMVFSKRNYVLILAGVCAVVIGYVMMRLENDVDGIISLYIAPIIILGGYLEIIWGILAAPDTEDHVAAGDGA